MEDTHSTNGRNLERKKNTKTQFANLHRVQIYKYTHRNYNWRTQQRKKNGSNGSTKIKTKFIITTHRQHFSLQSKKRKKINSNIFKHRNVYAFSFC